MAIEDRSLTVGTRLVANYRKQAVACMVEKRDEGGKLAFVLEDGKRYRSPSSAASAIMGGKAVTEGHPALWGRAGSSAGRLLAMWRWKPFEAIWTDSGAGRTGLCSRRWTGGPCGTTT